jgi:CubicO group peptidase (beta-lactamase class C family)
MGRSYSAFLLCLSCSLTPLATGTAQTARLDSLDAFVKAQMAQRHIRGLSLAIITDGKISVARAYGVVDDSSKAPATTSTLFQAGSISKPVSALGALHLVEAGTLSLDADVNTKLTSWKVPDNQFTATEKVTLRRLLSHNAGLTVHGFPGYDISTRVPTVVQVLDGTPPTNTAPIRVDTTPGAIWRYSGGGFTVMQQMVIDVTGQPFAQFLQKTVLGPIGMTSSSFEQPLPNHVAARTAAGYYADGSPVRGRWHVYPEIAAAGLWTTPTDLAKWAIEVQEALAGRGQRRHLPGDGAPVRHRAERRERTRRRRARYRCEPPIQPRWPRRGLRRLRHRRRRNRRWHGHHDQRERQLAHGLADPGVHRTLVGLQGDVAGQRGAERHNTSAHRSWSALELRRLLRSVRKQHGAAGVEPEWLGDAGVGRWTPR